MKILKSRPVTLLFILVIGSFLGLLTQGLSSFDYPKNSESVISDFGSNTLFLYDRLPSLLDLDDFNKAQG